MNAAAAVHLRHRPLLLKDEVGVSALAQALLLHDGVGCTVLATVRHLHLLLV